MLQFDGKLSAQDSVSALPSAIDPHAKVLFTGGSDSSLVAALVDAASKHNERNPERAIVVVNHSSIDPDVTGKRCNSWHFQREADAAMKMKALANHIKRQPDIHFVGQDPHAIGRVNDFAPCPAKMEADGTDGVITGYRAPT